MATRVATCDIAWLRMVRAIVSHVRHVGMCNVAPLYIGALRALAQVTMTKPSLASVPASDVTPEQALAALERTIAANGGMWAKGQRVNACRIAGQRLANHIEELNALRARLAEMETGGASLVQEALQAVAGTTPPVKSTGPGPTGTSDKPNTPATK